MLCVHICAFLSDYFFLKTFPPAFLMKNQFYLFFILHICAFWPYLEWGNRRLFYPRLMVVPQKG